MIDVIDNKRVRLAQLEAEAARLRAELGLEAPLASASDHGSRPLREGLSQREALLVEAERVAHLGSWSWDLRSNEISWSDELYRILGLEPGEVEPSTERFFSALHPDDRERVENSARLAVRDSVAIPTEFRFLRTTGEHRQVRLEATFLHDAEGRQTHMIGTVLDVTEQRQSAQLLARTVAELNEAQRIAGLVSWRWDAASSEVHWSSGMYRLLDIPDNVPASEEAFYQRVHFDDHERVRSAKQQILQGHACEPYEFRIVQSNGALRWLLQHTVCKCDHAGVLTVVAGVLQDITERKALEEQLRHSQKMEAVGTLAGGVAHDFNNYLMVIAGYTELLHEQLPAGDAAHESVQAISDAYHRCAHLTQQLLTLSRKRASQPVAVELSSLVAQLAPLIQSVLGELVHFDLYLEPVAMWTLADPLQVEQALMNLVVNARDAMPHGGELSVRVECYDDPSTGQAHVRLSVSDVGCGIPHELRSRVFEPFFTTKQVGQGTGLGLSTVYAIVRDSSARIDFESEPDLGTTFHIDWARCAAPTGIVRKTLPPPLGEQTQERSILIVEDVARVRRLLCGQLERAGYRVRTAPHGLAALELLAEHTFDLVLSDMVMPQLDGAGLARELRLQYPEVRCLLMTGYSPDALNADARGHAETLLRKPFSTAELLRAVRRALAPRRESLTNVAQDRP